jgi:hypothetical protein
VVLERALERGPHRLSGLKDWGRRTCSLMTVYVALRDAVGCCSVVRRWCVVVVVQRSRIDGTRRAHVGGILPLVIPVVATASSPRLRLRLRRLHCAVVLWPFRPVVQSVACRSKRQCDRTAVGRRSTLFDHQLQQYDYNTTQKSMVPSSVVVLVLVLTDTLLRTGRSMVRVGAMVGWFSPCSRDLSNRASAFPCRTSISRLSTGPVDYRPAAASSIVDHQRQNTTGTLLATSPRLARLLERLCCVLLKTASGTTQQTWCRTSSSARVYFTGIEGSKNIIACVAGMQRGSFLTSIQSALCPCH